MNLFIFLVEKVSFKTCFQIHILDHFHIYFINMLAFLTNSFDHHSVRHAFNQFSFFVLFTICVSEDNIIYICILLLYVILYCVNISHIFNKRVINESFSYCDAAL
jgi:hypothetical protein